MGDGESGRKIFILSVREKENNRGKVRHKGNLRHISDCTCGMRAECRAGILWVATKSVLGREEAPVQRKWKDKNEKKYFRKYFKKHRYL